MKVRWTEGAVENLRSAHAYMDAENPEAASDVVDQIVSAVERLERFPQMGRAGRVEGTQEVVVTGTPFVVAYRLKGESIQILAVLHAARKWPTGF